ncbi:hypothetical protein BLAT2472_50198 [Burkholderia latens]
MAGFRETKRRKLPNPLFPKDFLASTKKGHLFHIAIVIVADRCSGVGVSVENSATDVLRVLEVNTLEPLVKNVNATAQPYVARVSSR